MSDKMREAFEKEFIAGSGLDWNPDQGRYVGSPFGCGADQGEYIANVRWQAWQAALTQQPESEPLGCIDREVLGLIRWRDGLMMSELKQGMAIYGGPQPSAQVPEGWKVVPNSDIDQWLKNISEHGLPLGPHSFMLRTILNLAPAAPCLADKGEDHE